MRNSVPAVILLTLLFAALGSAQQVNPDAALIADFEKRVDEYMKLSKTAAAGLPALKPNASAEKLAHNQHELTEKIHHARKGMPQGMLFTPEISAEFRRLIKIAMAGGDAARVNSSLKHAEPVRMKARLKVNDQYPRNVPLQSMPPTLLSNLPHLPPELSYRLVSEYLVLLDVKTNLIVDFMTGAIPQ
jgi:hypothetical protein